MLLLVSGEIFFRGEENLAIKLSSRPDSPRSPQNLDPVTPSEKSSSANLLRSRRSKTRTAYQFIATISATKCFEQPASSRPASNSLKKCEKKRRKEVWKNNWIAGYRRPQSHSKAFNLTSKLSLEMKKKRWYIYNPRLMLQQADGPQLIQPTHEMKITFC